MRWDATLRSRRLDRLSKKSFVGCHIIVRGQKRLAPFDKRTTCGKSSAWIVVGTTGSPSSKYRHRQASALLRNIQNIRIPIVSVTYENERISIKNSLPYLKRFSLYRNSIYTVMITIFFFGGGGGEAGHFEGEVSTPQIPWIEPWYINVVSCHKGSLRTADVFPVVASLPPIFL